MADGQRPAASLTVSGPPGLAGTWRRGGSLPRGKRVSQRWWDSVLWELRAEAGPRPLAGRGYSARVCAGGAASWEPPSRSRRVPAASATRPARALIRSQEQQGPLWNRLQKTVPPTVRELAGLGGAAGFCVPQDRDLSPSCPASRVPPTPTPSLRLLALVPWAVTV